MTEAIRPTGSRDAARQPSSLRHAARRGFLWLAAMMGVGKASAMAAHVALGWFLVAEDWGLFALTISIAAFARILRGGSLGTILVQRGSAEYDRLSGPAFWMALCINLFTGAVLVGAGQAASGVYGHPELIPMLSVAALALVVGTPAIVLIAKLRAELAFRGVATISALSSIARWGCAVSLAACGVGAMSFVWAMVAAATVDSLAGWIATRDSPWTRRPRLAIWRTLYTASLWLLVGDFLKVLAHRADYLILGLLVALTIIGPYTFGYELTAQVGTLVAFNVQSVLFPILTRLAGAPRQLAVATEKLMAVLMFAGSAGAFLLCAVADAFETLAWQGKWHDAVTVIQIFAAVVPIRMMMTVPNSLLLAQGRYKVQAFVLSAQAMSLSLAALAAGSVFASDVASIALTIGCSQAVTYLVLSVLIVRSAGCRARSVLWSSLKPWLVAAAIAAAALIVDRYLLGPFEPLVRCAVLSAGYTLTLILAARVVMPQHLEWVSEMLPPRLMSVYRTALLLPQNAPVA